MLHHADVPATRSLTPLAAVFVLAAAWLAVVAGSGAVAALCFFAGY